MENTRIGDQLHRNKWFKLAEILLVFIAAFALIQLLSPLIGDHPVYKQTVVWLANVLMLLIVWGGLRLRGQGWSHLGLSLSTFSWQKVIPFFLRSLVVFALAIIAFLLSSVIMANITGIPERADMSSYDYLRGNPGMLLLTLVGVYIVSSFGEEVVYRGFLITRISEFGLPLKMGLRIAVIISSIVFGLVHYDWGPMGIVQTTLMGLALGLCYLKFKRNLWVLILAHAYMDTILMVQMYLASNS